MSNISTPDMIRGVVVPKHIQQILDQNPYPSNPNAVTPKYSAQLKKYEEDTAKLEALYTESEAYRVRIAEPLSLLQQQIDALNKQIKELEEAHFSSPFYLDLRRQIRELEDGRDISGLGDYKDREYPYAQSTAIREDYSDWVVRVMTCLRETYTYVDFDSLWKYVDDTSECSSRYIGGGEYEDVGYTYVVNKAILFVKLASMVKGGWA